MTFLHPAILFGLIAVGLPIAIHLLSRPRLKRIPWAAGRFLLLSVQKNRRRVQAEDILLLVLRCLLVALLVFLFARPALLTTVAPQLGGLAAPAVILLDNSASMGQSDGSQTRLEQAKGMVNDLLAHLSPGSSSALYLVSDHVKVLIAKPTEDFALLRRSLARAELSDGGSDLYPGLKMATDLLKGLPGEHKEIFVLTDSQASAWRELDRIKDLVDHNKQIAVHFLVVGKGGEDNLAVSGLQLAGTAAVDQPLRCAVTVSNYSAAAVSNISLKLAADNGPPQDEAMIDRIEPGSSRVLTLTARFHDAGYHSLTASIPGDRLPSDNQRSLALRVINQVHALVVAGKADPAAHDGFFLSHALVPVAPDQADDYYVKATTAGPAELEGPDLNQYQAVFLSDVAQISAAAAKNVGNYVRNGGALVIFPGPATDANSYNAGLDALLPATLGPVQTPAGQPFLAWQGKGYTHPLTTLWNEPDSGTLAGVRVSHYFPLALKPGDPKRPDAPQVIVNYADGTPAAVEQSVDKGKVILFSSSATTDWTTLPIHPSFVPLLVRTLAFVTNNLNGNLVIAPGDTFSAPVGLENAGRDYSAQVPGDSQRHLVGEIESSGTFSYLRYSNTEKAGPYSLFIGNEAKPTAMFAVQGDPDESNLAQEPQANIETLLNPSGAATGADGNPAAKESTEMRRVPGKELWLPLTLAALLLALAETTLAHRFSQAK